YVHASNDKRASLSDLAGLASILKTDVLDQDFYGQPADVEVHYVDKKGSARKDVIYDLKRLEKYLDEDPSVTLTRFASALVDVMENDRVTPPVRKKREAPVENDDAQGELSL